jgi:hypothetical protein
MSKSYINSISYIQRLKKSQHLLEKYNDRIPIIIEKNVKDNTLARLDTNKYLIHGDSNVISVLNLLREKLKLTENQSIYLTIYNTNVILNPSHTLNSVYNNHKHNDGFLYIEYYGENTFG